MEIDTPDGVLQIRLTFSGDVNLAAYLKNNENNRIWLKSTAIDNNAATTSVQISPDNPCGAFIGNCSLQLYMELNLLDWEEKQSGSEIATCYFW